MQVNDFTGSNPEGKSFLPSLHHGSFSMIAGAPAPTKPHTCLATLRQPGAVHRFCILAESSTGAFLCQQEGVAFSIACHPLALNT